MPPQESPAPIFSVVIPAYNAAAFIEETLASLASQTFRDFEVIVVDDGSADDTKGVVDRYLAREGLRGCCIRQPNKRIAAARNTGIHAAQGEWVAFLDHDDMFHPEKLAAVAEAVRAHPEARVITHHIAIKEDGRTLWVKEAHNRGRDVYDSLLFKGNNLAPPTVTAFRSTLLELGGFRENAEFNTVEDYDMWLRLARACRFHVIDRVLADYRQDPRGASRHVERHHTNHETLLRDHFRSLYGDSPPLSARLRIRWRLSEVYRSALSSLLRESGPAALRRRYAWDMIRMFPFSPKNLLRFLQALPAFFSR